MPGKLLRADDSSFCSDNTISLAGIMILPCVEEIVPVINICFSSLMTAKESDELCKDRNLQWKKLRIPANWATKGEAGFKNISEGCPT